MKCLHCGKEPKEILVNHEYSIDYDEVLLKWRKSDGKATYRCGNCLQELSIQDIKDILKQVDEL